MYITICKKTEDINTKLEYINHNHCLYVKSAIAIIFKKQWNRISTRAGQ